MKTKYFKSDEIPEKWYLVDAKDKIVGKVAVAVAKLLLGKGKTVFTPGAVTGDHVIVINTRQMRVTGSKLKDKTKFRHSGYPQGDKYESYESMFENKPARILYLAVKGMLPKNRIAARMLKHLRVYDDDKHDNAAQKPEKLEI